MRYDIACDVITIDIATACDDDVMCDMTLRMRYDIACDVYCVWCACAYPITHKPITHNDICDDVVMVMMGYVIAWCVW
jgi:hypothetical protein